MDTHWSPLIHLPVLICMHVQTSCAPLIACSSSQRICAALSCSCQPSSDRSCDQLRED